MITKELILWRKCLMKEEIGSMNKEVRILEKFQKIAKLFMTVSMLKHHYLLKKKQQEQLKRKKLLLRVRKRKVRKRRKRRRRVRKIRMTMVSHKLSILVLLKLYKGLMSNTKNSMKCGIIEMKVRIINKSMIVNLRKLRYFQCLKKNIKHQ